MCLFVVDDVVDDLDVVEVFGGHVLRQVPLDHCSHWRTRRHRRRLRRAVGCRLRTELALLLGRILGPLVADHIGQQGVRALAVVGERGERAHMF